MNQPLPVEGTDEPPQQKKYSLLRVLHKCFGVQFYSIGVLKLVGDGLGFAGPLLLHELVTFIENKDGDTISGYTYAGGLCGAALVGEYLTFFFLLFFFFILYVYFALMTMRDMIVVIIYHYFQHLNQFQHLHHYIFKKLMLLLLQLPLLLLL